MKLIKIDEKRDMILSCECNPPLNLNLEALKHSVLANWTPFHFLYKCQIANQSRARARIDKPPAPLQLAQMVF